MNFQTVVPVYPEKTEPIKAITVTRLLRLAVLVVMTGHTPCSHPDSLYPPAASRPPERIHVSDRRDHAYGLGPLSGRAS